MNRTPSTGRSRAELISAYRYGRLQAAAPPPPSNATPAPAEEPAADANAYEPEPYREDPDETVICPACQKHNSPDAVYCDQCGAKLAGASGVKVEPAGEAPLTAAPEPATPAASPQDEKGNIAPTVKCANPDCGHLASAHLNDDQMGANTGACSITKCACLGMQTAPAPNTGTGDSGGQNVGGAEPSSGSQELAHAPANLVPDAPVPPGPPAGDGSDLNAPPETEGGESMGPAFTIPVGVIEGQPTGDGRQIAPGALDWRTPPMPLMGLATETHDPMGLDQNDPAVLCGRIDSLERLPGEGATQIVCARGYFLSNEDGIYFAELTEAMGRVGISADVATEASEIEVGDIDEDGWPSEMSEILTKGTILGFTIVPYPAFEGAYIVLGDGDDIPPAQAIPQQAEKPPETVMAGGQLIHLMAYEACEPCEQGTELLAAGGPLAPPREWFENPNFTVGDGRLQEIIDRRGAGSHACPLTIGEDGRVFGHLAPWGVCHIGKPGCVTAPHSNSDYAYFLRGQHVVCADGSKVRVGTLTVDAGHADVRSDPASAMAHYDNIATAVADVACGEDEHGIWIAGAIRPSASAEQVRALRASSISGDWRGLGGSLELVAALAVPVPGFPHAVLAGGAQESLVASGTSVMHRLKHPPASTESMESYLPALRRLARRDARERLSALGG